jgi:hypothetical protein
MRLIKKAGNGKNESFADELKSELFLQICEMDETRLIELHATGEIIPYIETIISKQRHARGKGVNRLLDYLASGPAYLMDFIRDGEPFNNDAIDIYSALDKCNWFEKRIVELYVEYGSIKEAATHGSVSLPYAVKQMNSARKKIRDVLGIN